MEAAIGETEETSPGFKRSKGTSRAVNEVAADNGFKNEDLKPPSKDTAGCVNIEVNQERPFSSKLKGYKPNIENTSGATANNDISIGKEPKKKDVLSNRQVADRLQKNTNRIDESTSSNQNIESLPVSNNKPEYISEDDHFDHLMTLIKSPAEIVCQVRPEGSSIRERRHAALERVHDFLFHLCATPIVKDNDSIFETFAIEEEEEYFIDLNSTQVESDTTHQLLKDVVEETQHRQRRNIQVTNQQEHTLETSATDDVECVISPSTSNPHSNRL